MEAGLRQIKMDDLIGHPSLFLIKRKFPRLSLTGELLGALSLLLTDGDLLLTFADFALAPAKGGSANVTTRISKR